MPRPEPYLGELIAIALVLLVISILPGNIPSPAKSPVATTSSSTITIVSDGALPAVTLPNLITDAKSPAPAASATSTTTPKAVIPAKPKPEMAAAVETPLAAPVPPPTPPVSDNADLNAVATTLRNALVNILCYAPAGGSLRSISGSGVLITSSGIILTNAHVAQNFLLTDRGVSCTIRTGSPASDSYKAALVFISPAWVAANKDILTKTLPSGTGEGDIALLAVTESATRTPLPTVFPFIPPALTPSGRGTPVVIATYGAQFLQTSQVQSSLFPTIVFGSVKDLFTFATNTVDVFALGGSAAAQEGSSGGGVANVGGELIGTITTSTVTGDTSTRTLDAITLSYIRADYASETGSPLDALLASPTSNSIAAFAPQMSALESLLTASLP